MKNEGMASRASLADGWKRDVALALKTLGLVDDRYTGRIVLNLHQGVITDVERTERLK